MVEREWREASDMRRSTLPLLAILTVAALLRFGGGALDSRQIGFQRSNERRQCRSIAPETD